MHDTAWSVSSAAHKCLRLLDRPRISLIPLGFCCLGYHVVSFALLCSLCWNLLYARTAPDRPVLRAIIQRRGGHGRFCLVLATQCFLWPSDEGDSVTAEAVVARLTPMSIPSSPNLAFPSKLPRLEELSCRLRTYLKPGASNFLGRIEDALPPSPGITYSLTCEEPGEDGGRTTPFVRGLGLKDLADGLQSFTKTRKFWYLIVNVVLKKARMRL